MNIMLGILIGGTAHTLFYDLVDRTALPELSSYVLGVLSNRLIFKRLLSDMEPVQAYDYSFASVGLGVAIARFIRSWLTTPNNGRK